MSLAIKCTRPRDKLSRERYKFSGKAERNLEVPYFDADAECEDGFWAPRGTPKAAQCNNRTGGAYLLSGCEPVTCDGRVIEAKGNDALVGRGHSNTPLDDASTGYKAPEQPYQSTLVFPCVEGYRKAVVRYTCGQTRKFETEETCDPVLCTEPTTTGYDFSGASKDEVSREVPTFGVTGVTCSAGFFNAGSVKRGTAANASPCHSRLGGKYSVSGCTGTGLSRRVCATCDIFPYY